MPDSFWQHLFLTDHPLLSKVWGPLIGPVVAMLSFVCSIGNVPLAAVLWNGGISFGGVVSFLFADLIIVPILIIYRKYYGTRMMLVLLGIFYVTMVLAGYVVELALRRSRPGPASQARPGGGRGHQLELHDLAEHRLPAAGRCAGRPLLPHRRARHAGDDGRLAGGVGPVTSLDSWPLSLLVRRLRGGRRADLGLGVKLSETTDVLDSRLHLGSAFGGLIMLAVATNLPEIAITVSASVSGNVEIAVGNILGGIGLQTVVLAVLDFFGKRGRASGR